MRYPSTTKAGRPGSSEGEKHTHKYEIPLDYHVQVKIIKTYFYHKENHDLLGAMHNQK